MSGKSRQEREIDAVVRAYDAWSARWTGLTRLDDVLGELTWTEWGWTFESRVPLFGGVNRCVIDSGKAPGDHDTSGEPEPPGVWAGRLWSKFCEEWPAGRRSEALEILHAFVRQTVDEWVERPHVRDNPDQLAHIKKFRDSFAHFKQSLALDDVRLCRYGRRRYVSMHFETEFAEGYGLNLFFIEGRKSLKPTFGNQLGPD